MDIETWDAIFEHSTCNISLYIQRMCRINLLVWMYSHWEKYATSGVKDTPPEDDQNWEASWTLYIYQTQLSLNIVGPISLTSVWESALRTEAVSIVEDVTHIRRNLMTLTTINVILCFCCSIASPNKRLYVNWWVLPWIIK